MAVSGLIGLNGDTLRQHDFDAIRAIAELPLHGQDRLLLSADRVRDQHLPGVDRSRRVDLIDRFGLAGLRYAVAVVRRGEATTAGVLAGPLIEQSGIVRIRQVLLSGTPDVPRR